MRWRPLQPFDLPTRSWAARELIWSRRDQPDGLQNGMGYLRLGDYQFARRWFAGARYDRSDRADDASLFDTGQSLVLTYWPSEFSQVRGQYRRTDTPTARRRTSSCSSSSFRSARMVRTRSSVRCRSFARTRGHV